MNSSELLDMIPGLETWTIEVFIVVFFTAFLNWIQKRILSKVIVQLERTSTYWDDALFDAARKPLSFLIWVIGLTFAADIVKNQTDAAIFGAIAPIRDVGVIIVISWFLVRFIGRAEKKYYWKKTGCR